MQDLPATYPRTSPPKTEDNKGNALTLSIVPVTFNRETVSIGRVPFINDEEYERLRSAHRETHVCRFDHRDTTIVNVSLRPGIQPLGEASEGEAIHDHLLLLGKVLQHSILGWLQPRRAILKRSRPVVFWGGTQEAKLLSRAIEQCRLTPRRGLEVVTRYSVDTRVLQVPDNPKHSYLAVLIDIDTSNVLDVPLHELIKAGFDPRGRYVCRRPGGAGSPAHGGQNDVRQPAVAGER